ncbi:MAG: transporter substrate-binding domain-containing protein [Chloroflexi bacterium]|nr:transporter substrate-binding domain-containing protein [Chloroflexota bacterium]
MRATVAPPSAALVGAIACGIALLALLGLAGCGQDAPPVEACTDDNRTLTVGFYAFFAPVSYSADEDPTSAGFDTHLGYEADLVTALEAMDDTGLSFVRRGIAAWDDIWLQSAGPDYDLIGGGITILDSRTRDAAGRPVVVFTSGHIAFRQSLLVRAADAERLAGYDDLRRDVRVGALAGTTGEARLLELTGLADAHGALTAGTRVETPRGTLVADGSAIYTITAAGASPNLDGRRRLDPPSADLPQVIYLGDDAGETELLQALRDGRIDAIARGEVGNRDADRDAGGAFAVTALDAQVEHGGFTLAAKDAALASCLDERIAWLTDNRRFGYAEWLDDPTVFMRRAEIWNARAQ